MSETEEDFGDDWAAAMNEQAESEGTKSSADPYPTVDFPEFDEQKPQKILNPDEVKLEVILDVPVTLSLEIGRTKINIRNLLQLNQGSVVELDRFAGEPMDVLVNGTLVAHGEVVVVNDKFGIRLTDIISPSERVRKLG
ncbi:MAG: flagellar motor switch protein FliN [Methylomonas sp.]|jgi:flagellar motor switch protein FliN/FliY